MKKMKKMKKISDDELSFIGECFLRDTNIQERLGEKANNEKIISKLVQIFTSHAKEKNIVYTAFDGDHFHFLQHMRKCVLDNNHIPANPESILGYKNIVTRYQSKYGVLLDDLAILQSCEDLWVFTDVGTNIKDVLDLPEGVLVEIAFYLKRHSIPTINFVSLSTLLKEGRSDFRKLSLSFDELEKALLKSERREIINIANNNFKVDKDLKNLVFYITDPLDYKYSEWLREDKASNTDEIALVPGLTSRIHDVNYGAKNIGNIVLSWASILLKLSRKRAYSLDSFESRRNPSIISEALKKYCIQIKGAPYLKDKKWEMYSIPKALQREKWPITKHEADLIMK